MAQLLQHQESAFYDKELNGRRWGILQFFGFRRRLRSTKLLSDKTQGGQGKGSGGSRRRSCYAPLKNEDSGIMDEDRNNEVPKKRMASRKNSGKPSLRSMILRKLYGKEGQKEKMLPVAPKLLRTISIHYLETNEYVDGDSTSSADGSSHGSKLSMQDATNMNLQHAASDTLGCSENNTISLLSLKRDNSLVKRKSHRSISMDGVLHKVPYGKMVSDDLVGEALPRSASATYDRDGPKPYIGGNFAKRHVNQGFRRSRSLSESLESYTRLLDSVANSESKRMLTSSKSTRDHSVDGPNMISASPRTSNAEFRLQSLTIHDETTEDAFESLDNGADKINVHGDKEVGLDERPSDEITVGSENLSLPDECTSDRKCDVAVSAEAHLCIGPSPSEAIDLSKAHAETCGDNDQDHSPIEVDLCDPRSAPEEVDTPDQHAAICGDDEIQSSTQADSRILPSEDTTRSHDNQMHPFQNAKSIEGTFYIPDPGQEFEADISLSYEPETESPISVLDVVFSDDPASPVKRTKLDGTLLKPKILHLNDTEVSNSIDVVQENDSDYTIGLQVDPTHEDEFNYVKDIFNKSSFSNETHFDEWYLQNIIALQEEDCQHYEAAPAAFDFADMSAEQLLLFDLTNEALLDIYRKHSVSKSRLSRFSSSKPVGHAVLRELWSRLSHQLDDQPQSAVEVDMILSRDLARSDHWINFQRDAETLGNSLGDFVLDKLLTELVLELADF